MEITEVNGAYMHSRYGRICSVSNTNVLAMPDIDSSNIYNQYGSKVLSYNKYINDTNKERKYERG